MLDDRKTKPRAADLFAVALVNAIKALKNALLMFLRDTYSRVGHGEARSFVLWRYGHRDAAAGSVVLYRVVAQVVGDK